MRYIYLALALTFCAVPLYAAHIVAAEYFFDNDPGPGNGHSLTVPSSGDPIFGDTLVTLTPTLPTSTLSSGLHSVSLRYRDNLNRWSPTGTRFFYYLNELPPLQANITGAEYFYDNDPGLGSGQSIAISAGPNPAINIALPTQTLTSGVHRIGLRYRDQYLRWSNADQRSFYIVNEQPPMQANITAAEYFLDVDPGQGAAHPIPITASPNPSINTAIDLTNVAAGVHRIGLRYRDQYLRWSAADQHFFYVVNEQPLVRTYLAGAEYFINSDPGFGNGVQIPFPNDGQWNDSIETISDTVRNIPVGQHWIGMRFRDNHGNWSATAVDTFIVGPVITANPASNNQDLILHWQTGPGATGFTIKRANSINGNYSTVGTSTTSSYTDAGILNTPAARYYYYIMETDPGLSMFRLPRTRDNQKVSQE